MKSTRAIVLLVCLLCVAPLARASAIGTIIQIILSLFKTYGLTTVSSTYASLLVALNQTTNTPWSSRNGQALYDPNLKAPTSFTSTVGLSKGITWNLMWADEFTVCTAANCVNGGINLDTWSFEMGDGSDYSVPSWGNNEQECYTTSSNNAYVQPWSQSGPGDNDDNDDNPCGGNYRSGGGAVTNNDGYLVIQAQYKSKQTCYNAPRANAAQPTSLRDWTSARLVTRNKANFQWAGTAAAAKPIRIEASIQFPLVAGSWPALWMLPDTNLPCLGCGAYGNGWCSSGDINLFEHRNNETSYITNMIYGGTKNVSYWGCWEKRGTVDLGQTASGWHTYAVEWNSTWVQWFVDNTLVNTATVGQWYTGTNSSLPYAPFDQPFHLILNQAIGGYYPGVLGNPSASPQFLVDYIRMYCSGTNCAKAPTKTYTYTASASTNWYYASGEGSNSYQW